MRVIGIDPGTAITGYGIVQERSDGQIEAVAYGVVTTPAKTPLPARLQLIYCGLQKVIAEHVPESAAVEKLLFGRNVTTAMSVGQARGVALLTLVNSGLAIAEYTPMEVKQAVAGYGNADKPQMQEMVRLLLGLDVIPRPDDAADALAIAITHLHVARYQEMIED